MDLSTRQEQRSYHLVTVDRLDSFWYLGVHLTQESSCHMNTLVKRFCHLNLPSKVVRNFRTCTTKFGNSTIQDMWALQRGVRTDEHTNLSELPDLQAISSKQYWTRARKITKDLSHPNNGLFCLC